MEHQIVDDTIKFGLLRWDKAEGMSGMTWLMTDLGVSFKYGVGLMLKLETKKIPWSMTMGLVMELVKKKNKKNED